MIPALLKVRFRGLFDSFVRQGKRKGKSSPGMNILFGFLYLYLTVVMVGAFCFAFMQLAPAYHSAGLDWVYFATAAVMGLAVSVFGNVFMTQSQLYDAKDNELLLSMPISPAAILFSRIAVLMAMTVLFCGIVMLPAMVVYAVTAVFSVRALLFQLLCFAGVCFLSQGICCLLGWVLHAMLSRMNKSFASVLYMAVFLAAYFSLYSQAGTILNAIASDGGRIGSALRSWVWPVYAAGVASTGSVPMLLAFLGICAVFFGAVYRFLTVTFLKAATTRTAAKRRTLSLRKLKTGTAVQAIVYKEWRHFLASPVYITNMGIGFLMVAAICAAGIVLRSEAEQMLTMLPEEFSGAVPLAIMTFLGSTAGISCVSAPSVSLEGKNIWVLRSMPVSGRQVIFGKLLFHVLVMVPVTVLSGWILGIVYGCGWVSLLCGVVPGLVSVLGGVFGLVCGLKWVRLEWLSEAYPCKQSVAVLATMLPMMFLPGLLALLYFALLPGMDPGLYLALCGAGLAIISLLLWRLLMTWGARRWDSLN